MAELHPIARFLIGVATIGAVLGVAGLLADYALKDRFDRRIHEILLEASALTWAMGAMLVLLFVAWVYIVQGMLFEAALFGLLGAVVIYLFAFFLYPAAVQAVEETGQAADGGSEETDE